MKTYPCHKGSFIIPRLGGGRHPPEILITLANHLICTKDFFTCPFILPKDSEKSKIENFSSPLQDALKIFAPFYAELLKNFCPPLT